MIDSLLELQNVVRKRADGLVQFARNRGLREAARLARRLLGVSRTAENLEDWEVRTVETLLARMCNYDDRLPPPGEIGAVDETLAFVERLPATRRAQFRDLLALFEAASLVLGPDGQRRRFSELDPAAADAYLRSWDESALPPRRAAFRALKSICMMGYWSRPDAWPPIGYSLDDNPGLDTS